VHRESDTYFIHPYLDGDACARLLALGVRTIGIDAINIDETPAGDLDLERFRCHAQISAAGGVIVENLAGLDAIDFPAPLISVLPLRLAGGDGAPARAVAIEGLA
jgi:kynurenine formamidase